jgi:RND family efflux transporter MFP subunit
VILLRGCTTTYSRTTTIGNFTAGGGSQASRIQEMFVREGDRVKAGQVVGILFNKDMLAECDMKRAALASAEVNVRQQEVNWALEKAKLERLERIGQRGALLVSTQEVQIQQISVKVAEYQVKEAVQDRVEAEADLTHSQAILSARNLIAPHDGVVVEILANVGEAVGVKEAILRMVDVDHVRVTGFLDAPDAWRVRRGLHVRVFPELAGGKLPIEREVFDGHISFVHSEIDPVSRTCKVFADVENREQLLRSGIDCRVEINLGQGQAGPGRAPAANAASSPAQRNVSPSALKSDKKS